MIEQINTSFLRKYGGFMAQNMKDGMEDSHQVNYMSEKPHDMIIGFSKNGLIEPIPESDRIRNNNNFVKKVPKNHYFELSDEFYDLSIKQISTFRYSLIPSIKNQLTRTTKFTGDDLEDLKDLFVEYSSKHRGMDYDSFKECISELYGFSYHPFSGALFNFIDKKGDSLIDFIEFVQGLSVILNGNLEQKSKFCFEVLDMYSNKMLGVHELNDLFNICYVRFLEDIQNIFRYFKRTIDSNETLIVKDIFRNIELIKKWKMSFEIVADRNERVKFYISAIQQRHKFSLRNLEELWNLYKGYLIKNISKIEKKKKKSDIEILLLQNMFRQKGYDEDEEEDPFCITSAQFKILMMELFKIRDIKLLMDLFNCLVEDEKKDSIPIKDFFEIMALQIEGDFNYKLAIVLDVYCIMNNSEKVPYDDIIKLLSKKFEELYNVYTEAKETANRMGFATERFISYAQFHKEVQSNPKSMDFLFRLSLGEYKEDTLFDIKRQEEIFKEGFDKKIVEKYDLQNPKNRMIGYKEWTHR